MHVVQKFKQAYLFYMYIIERMLTNSATNVVF